ncbi:alpha/beta hydrolase family protein [Desulfogranum mediterraneum]|uniref:alpha/beta hydrolase family protein n=1 Tax=Desulfogranum mediterraneum TaxID=160661 RepID=UPI0004902F16|nr:alpha/beta fold hydrolase [Desulfogranum mediterraneum]
MTRHSAKSFVVWVGLCLFFNSLFFPGAIGARTGEAETTRLKVVFDNPTYDFELQRTLGVTLSGGADINECLATARKIRPGDDESWYTHWRALADRIYQQAEIALGSGHRVSARENFQRACNYYRTSEFFLHGNREDPRIVETWRLSRDAFRRAAPLMPHPVEVVAIPYENTTLPGYFLQPDASLKPRKTVIIQTGFDGTAEELYFTRAVFALARGYNALLFEGPGQGGALREQQLYFRPDWEHVVTPVVNYLLTRKEVDQQRIALMGISMGGYLAPRAAAFEHRLAALVANPGSDDLYVQDRSLLSELEHSPEQSNLYLKQAMAKDLGFRWFIENGMFSTNTRSPADFLLHWSQYRMREEISQIRTNTLCVGSRRDHFMGYERFRRFYDRLQSPKTFLLFSAKEAAEAHCQMGALAVSANHIYDWLDQALEKIP